MFNPVKGIINHYVTAHLVHRLPGRVRIHFPALARLSSDWYRFATPVAELVKIKKGISEIDIQPLTGNVLITYDKDSLDEREVFNWLESMAKIILKVIPNRMPITENRLEALLTRVRVRLMALEN